MWPWGPWGMDICLTWVLLSASPGETHAPSGLRPCPRGAGSRGTDSVSGWLSIRGAVTRAPRASHVPHDATMPISWLPPGTSHALSQGFRPQACPQARNLAILRAQRLFA